MGCVNRGMGYVNREVNRSMGCVNREVNRGMVCVNRGMGCVNREVLVHYLLYKQVFMFSLSITLFFLKLILPIIVLLIYFRSITYLIISLGFRVLKNTRHKACEENGNEKKKKKW
uniref:Transmembrane protein n=1 Tax=Cacopsylla melanoneura TaxID=428564 RepID=A0A8D8Y7J9_9HEMI